MNHQQLISFITRDAQKTAPFSAWRFASLAFSVVFPFVLVFATGVQRGLDEFGLGRLVIALAVLVLMQAAIPFVTNRAFLYRPIPRFLLLVGFSMAAVAPFVRLSADSFHQEVSFFFSSSEMACFVFGASVSVVAFLFQLVLLRRFGPLLDSAARFTFALSVGISGLIALELHCPSDSVEHLLISHIGHALVVFPFALLVVSLETRSRLQKIRPVTPSF